jgi:Recombination endonuclease VII
VIFFVDGRYNITVPMVELKKGCMVGPMRTTKRCPHCAETKPIGEFLRPRTGAPSDYCHPCRQEKRRREYQRAGGSAVSYAKNLAKRGLTLTEYDAVLASQDGRCASCFRPETAKNRDGSVRRLAVDFDAGSDRLRGLLCHRCSVVAGTPPQILLDVVRYLAGPRP